MVTIEDYQEAKKAIDELEKGLYGKKIEVDEWLKYIDTIKSYVTETKDSFSSLATMFSEAFIDFDEYGMEPTIPTDRSAEEIIDYHRDQINLMLEDFWDGEDD